MGKTIMVKVSREDIESAIQLAIKSIIAKKVEDIVKRQNLSDQIDMAVRNAVIDVNLPDVELKLVEIEQRLTKLEEKKWIE